MIIIFRRNLGVVFNILMDNKIFVLFDLLNIVYRLYGLLNMLGILHNLKNLFNLKILLGLRH